MRVDPAVKPRRKRRGQFHHGDLAEQVALAAAHVVEAEGHAAVNLKRIAARLGVSEPAIYRHYQSREHVLAEVAARGLASFLEETRLAAEGLTDPLESLRAYGHAYVRASVARPGWFRLMFSRLSMEGLARFPQAAMRIGPEEAKAAPLYALWARALPESDGRADDLFRLVWGTAHGLSVFVVERVFQKVQTDDERVAAANAAIDLLIDSLKTPPTAPSASR